MDNFDQLEEKALGLAGSSPDPDSLLKASQALSTIRQLRGYRPTPVWPTVLTSITALLAVLLTAMTLNNQTKESVERRDAAEDAQWTEAMKQISLKDASVQTGIFGIQGFLDSRRHGVQAREVASALLPLTDNKDTFEIVLKGLIQRTNANNQRDLIGIAKTIAYNEWDIFNGLKTSNVPPGCPDDDIVSFLNYIDRCYQFKEGEELPIAKRAWLYSWEIDSMSDALGKLWQKRLPGVSPSNLNLSAIILENTDNLKGVHFDDTQLEGAVIHLCDLSGAHFDRAKFRGAIFHQLQKFEDSTWKDANWWDARSISCSLSKYLAKNYRPSLPDQQARADLLVDHCTPDDE
jgi:hypothetical protein